MSVGLKLTGVTKRFGSVQALAGIDLYVGDDELVAVLGPTGAGKTTLLRLVAGLEVPDAGRVELHGIDITRLEPSLRDIAMVFQNFALYPDWTVRRNLQFPLVAPGRCLSPTEIDERVDWVVSHLKIHSLLDQPAMRLSGGEMQRVALARAMVRRPRLFLLDEPLTNMDAKLREDLRLELTLLRRRLGVPMLYVTHDQAEALSMADRVVVLDQGSILQVDKPEVVYRRPASPRVARQVGEPIINLLAVRRQGNSWETGAGIPVAAATGIEAEGILGVRPQDVKPTGGSIPGRIRLVQNTGLARILLVDWAGQCIQIVVDQSYDFRIGDKICPRVEESRAIFWGTDNERDI